jgi:hypothetical protein
MVEKIYLVPSLTQRENIWMYCNYARMAPHEERCLVCEDSKCQHQGKHTVLTKIRGGNVI